MTPVVPVSLLHNVTVPSVPESMTVLEDLCETFIEEGRGLRAEVAQMLRLSVTEACRNALNQRDPSKSFNVSSLRFFRLAEDTSGLAVEVEDSGLGFRVEACAPPYPGRLVGREHILKETPHGALVASVETPLSVSLSFREAAALSASERDREGGLAAIARAWEMIIFRHHPGHGTVLRLERPRAVGL